MDWAQTVVGSLLTGGVVGSLVSLMLPHVQDRAASGRERRQGRREQIERWRGEARTMNMDLSGFAFERQPWYIDLSSCLEDEGLAPIYPPEPWRDAGDAPRFVMDAIRRIERKWGL